MPDAGRGREGRVVGGMLVLLGFLSLWEGSRLHALRTQMVAGAVVGDDTFPTLVGAALLLLGASILFVAKLPQVTVTRAHGAPRTRMILGAAIGSLLGTLVGVLPGLGPTAAIAILFPLTTVLPPAPAIIMLAGIYYGAMYGGSTTSILLNIPGEVASVPTCLDGYPMAQQGRGGVALGISAIGSFFAGTLGVVALTFFAPFLADQALRFGPPEYFGLMVLAFTVIASLSGVSLLKGFAMAFLGYFISLIGLGPSTAEPRFTFNWGPLMGGVDLIALIVGLYAISEV